MDSDTVLDYAVFQLSPRRSRCELFVSGNGKTEKLASGFLKPFIAQSKVVEEQAVKPVKLIKLEVEKQRKGATWFSKGTLERFVHFVSTPEVLELVNTFDAEMSQLEGARSIYSQGVGDPLSGRSGENESAMSAAADTTKKELLRAIDVRLDAVKQDLDIACHRASSAGFTLNNVSDLLLFADYFGASRLNEACTKFVSLCQRQPELISHQHQPQALPMQLKSFSDENVRSSSSSDMSIDEPEGQPVVASKPAAASFLHKLSNGPTEQVITAESSGASELPKSTQRGFVEQENEKVVENPAPSMASAAEPAEKSGGGSSRRLSVQDRINLFESKQKEQSTTSSITAHAGPINRVVTGKCEHRRLPSDVSEKSVLRRWSGVSDMSIDLNSSSISNFKDRNDSDTASLTPTSVNLPCQSSSKSEENETAGFIDTATSKLLSGPQATATSSLSSQVQFKGFRRSKSYTQDEGTSLTLSKPVLERVKGKSTGGPEFCGMGNQDTSREKQIGFLEGDGASLKDNVGCYTEPKAIKVKDRTAFLSSPQSVSIESEQVGWEDQESFRESRGTSSVVDHAEVKGQLQSVVQTIVRNTDAEPKGSSDSQIQFQASSATLVESNLWNSQAHRRMFPGESEEVGRRDAAATDAPCEALLVKIKGDDSTPQGTYLHRQTAGPDLLRKTEGRRGGGTESETNIAAVLSVRKAKNTKEEPDPSSTGLMDLVQFMKPSKGNQELNDDLQMKANELEKLFEAHKLRIQNDQPASSWRTKALEVKEDNVPKTLEKRQPVTLPELPDNLVREISNNCVDFDATLLLKMVDSEYDSNVQPRVGTFGTSDDLRGKLYDRYMQKRNTKLQEEWISKRAQKEAMMKAMHVSLESSQAEMRAKFAGSAEGQNLNSARRRAEKLRYFSTHSGLRIKDQQADESFWQGAEDIKELYEQVNPGQDMVRNGLFADSSSKRSDLKNLLLDKSLSSFTPRTSIASVPKPSAKSTNIKPRNQAEKNLAESVPDFSDLRKENTKPSTTISRINTRTQKRHFSRSKSIIEEANRVQEDKPRRSQSMRKSTSSPGELADLSLLNSDNATLTTSEISKEKTNSFINKIQKGGESKPLSSKSIGTCPGLGVGIDKIKDTAVSEANNREDSKFVLRKRERLLDSIRGEELERTSAQMNIKTDTEKPRQSQEFGNSDDPGSGIADAERNFFKAVAGNVQDSLGGSPRSWNSNNHRSFSYVHETSYMDASVDSPMQSPASWNFHPLNQLIESDAARMRKKWGNVQVPVFVANGTQQPCEDVTKGFKRLLKFGRKNRGLENLATDWVSASTVSDGDDNTEDGHDMIVQPSDDFRTSRMGFPLPPDDVFEDKNFLEQAQSLRSSIAVPPANFKLREDQLTGSTLKAPRSFFSISSLRNKGVESKIR